MYTYHICIYIYIYNTYIYIYIYLFTYCMARWALGHGRRGTTEQGRYLATPRSATRHRASYSMHVVSRVDHDATPDMSRARFHTKHLSACRGFQP